MDSLLVSDPQRFMKLVMLDNPRERKDGLKTLDDIVLCEILRFGIHNEPATSAAPFLSCFLPLEGCSVPFLL